VGTCRGTIMLQLTAPTVRQKKKKRSQMEADECSNGASVELLADAMKKVKLTRFPGEFRLKRDAKEIAREIPVEHVLIKLNPQHRLSFTMRINRLLDSGEVQDLWFDCAVPEKYPHNAPTFILQTEPRFPVSNDLRCSSIPGTIKYTMIESEWMCTYTLLDCIVQLLRLFYASPHTEQMVLEQEGAHAPLYFARRGPRLHLPEISHAM